MKGPESGKLYDPYPNEGGGEVKEENINDAIEESTGREFENILIPETQTPDWSFEDWQEAIDKGRTQEKELNWVLNRISEENNLSRGQATGKIASEFGIRRRPRGRRRGMPLPEKSDQELERELKREWFQGDEETINKTSGIILELIKKYQPENWDPTNPVRFKGREERNFVTENTKLQQLHHDVEKMIEKRMKEEGITPEKDWRLRLYTASDTPLDHAFSTDAVFEYGPIRIRMDITKQVNEGGEVKADQGYRDRKPDTYLLPQYFNTKNPTQPEQYSRLLDIISKDFIQQLQRKKEK